MASPRGIVTKHKSRVSKIKRRQRARNTRVKTRKRPKRK